VRRLAGWVLVLMPLLLAGCGVAPRAVVVDRNPAPRTQPSPHATGAQHVVRRGDTLYGIAFRHGLDYRQVAAWNRIAAPYTIYPGQRIRLSPAAGTVAAANPPRSLPASSPAASPSTPATPAPVTRPVNAPPAAPVVSAPSAPISAPTASTTPAPGSSTPPAASTSTPSAPSTAPSGPLRWQWPTAGQIVSRYVSGDPTRQGVSIVGNPGQAVNAAADGVVVYSGSGLIGYGELVIVKHSDEFLSAYGHNRRRLVAEGEQVKAGQQIAEMGRSGAARDMLHFEIRRNGRPVDPMGFLPAR
jgi:lipoprotein NlpD